MSTAIVSTCVHVGKTNAPIEITHAWGIHGTKEVVWTKEEILERADFNAGRYELAII